VIAPYELAIIFVDATVPIDEVQHKFVVPTFANDPWKQLIQTFANQSASVITKRLLALLFMVSSRSKRRAAEIMIIPFSS
jgi:hypothetical protein